MTEINLRLECNYSISLRKVNILIFHDKKLLKSSGIKLKKTCLPGKGMNY